MTDQPLKRRYQDIARNIRGMLETGGWRVGDRLPPERQISEDLDTSRSTVREAMIMLEIEGLVEVRQGAGVYVRALPGRETIQSLTTVDIGPFELLQARQLLESHIAGFAATLVTKSDIVAMQNALDQEAREIDAGRGDYDGDAAFHRLIAEATQNAGLMATVENLWTMRAKSAMWARLHSRIFDETYRRKWLFDHGTILASLKRRDPEGARTAMWRHLANVRETLLALSDVEDPDFDAYLFKEAPADVRD